jgi:hypothetical protein
VKKIPDKVDCSWVRLSARKVLEFCNEIQQCTNPGSRPVFDLECCVEFSEPTYEIDSNSNLKGYVFDKYFILEDFYEYIFDGDVIYTLSDNEIYRPYLIDDFHFLLAQGTNVKHIFKRFYEENLFDDDSRDYIDSLKTLKVLSGEVDSMERKAMMIKAAK